MFKRFNLFVLILLIVGQTILTPMATAGAVDAGEPSEQGDNETNDEPNEGEDSGSGDDNSDEGNAGGSGNSGDPLEVVNKDDLKTLLDDAESKNESDYTADSYADFVSAVTAGKQVYEDDNATQVNVNDAVDAIRDAIGGLQKKTPTPEAVDDGDDDALNGFHAFGGGFEPFSGPKTGFNFSISKAQDKFANEIDPNNLLDITDEFFIGYKWDLENTHNYKDGDTVSFNLPPQLSIGTPDIGDLRDSDNKLIATYKLNANGTITITFTDEVESLSNIHGTVWLESLLDQSKIEVDDGEITIGPFEGGGSLTVPIIMDNLGATISKQGTPVPAFSPTEIEWTITVDAGIVNQSNGVVTDTLPEGLTYKTGSTLIDGSSVSDTDIGISGNELTFTLGDFNGTKTITYKTDIESTHFNEGSFTNDAKYKADNSSEIDTDASVTIRRGEPLEKNPGSYDSTTREITWTVNINFDGQDITNPQDLVDSWDADMKLEGDIVLQKVKLDDNGNPSNDGAEQTLTPTTTSDTGFTVEIPAISEPHILTYKTKLDNRVLYGEGSTIDNTVSWNGNENISNRVYAGPNLGFKTHGTPNYDAQTVQWTLVYNQDQQPMTNTEITDILTDGLSLVNGVDDINVTVSGVNQNDIVKSYDETTKEIKININTTTSSQITVTYTTSFDYSKLPDGTTGFPNTATIKWEDENGTDQTDGDTLKRTFTPNPATQADGTKSGTYDPVSKEITWTVVANYQRNDYTNLVVRDEPQGNQKLLPETIEVHEATVQSGGGVEPVNKVQNPNITIDGNNFTVELGATNKTHQIVYKTSLEELSDIAASYENKAYVSDNGANEIEITATASITNGGSYASKTGNQNGNVMDWEVVVNATQATINNVVLTDTLSTNQEFLENSIKVYDTNPGTTTKRDELSVGTDYTFTISEDIPQTLTLNFINEINRAYVVEYSTLYFAAFGEDVSNNYKITASGTEGDTEQGSTATRTIQFFSGGNASGEAGYLKVKKTANDDPDKVFKDVTFNLIDPVSGTVLKTDTTDKDGMIDFGRLKYGTYELEEVASTVPDGYATPSENFEVVIDTAYNPADPSTIHTEEIENKKIRRGFEFTKVDANDTSEVLEGAIFELRKKSETDVITTLKTDENGRISYGELEPGDYELVEIKAPVGYKLDATPVEFEIEANQTEPTKVGTNGEVTNDPNEESVTLLKFHENRDGTLDETRPLEGAEFTLYHENGDIVKDANDDDLSGLTTNEYGELIVEGLDPGDYYFLETKAPSGYQLDRNTKHEFTIEADDSEVIKVGNKVRTGGGWIPPPDPEDPTDPEEPGEDPEDPTDPEEPGEDPEDPTDPEEPGEDPEDPTDPEEPGTDPEDPTDPEEPGEDPTDPTDSTDPKEDGNGLDGPEDDDGNIKGGGSEKSPTDSTGSTGTDEEGSKGLLGAGGQKGDGDKDGILPKTATNIYNLIFIGLGLLAIGASILIYRRRMA